MYSLNKILGKMDSVHNTFFEEVKNGGYETVVPCNEVVVFGIKADRRTEYKVTPMLCGSFCIVLVADGTAHLSVNYKEEVLCKNSLVFLTPNMVISLGCADKDFEMNGVCFRPAYFDNLSAYAPVYNQMTAFLNDKAMPIQLKWHWGFKKYFMVTLVLLTFYEASMYFLIGSDTNREAFFIPLFALGVSEVMIGSASNVYLSQSLPFSHFFFGLSSIGYIRCGIGTAMGSAVVQRLYNWSISKNSINAGDNLDGTVLPFDMPSWSNTLSVVSKQAMMIAIKECYGYLIAIGIVMMILIIIHHYRLPVKRLLPRMSAIRIWMNKENTNDPKDSVIPNDNDDNN